jgi:hypothetical protein
METSGYKGWWEMTQPLIRDREGAVAYREVFANTLTGEIVAPEEGWNGEPPGRTGEIVRPLGGSDEFWANMAAHREHISGLVVFADGCRTVITY